LAAELQQRLGIRFGEQSGDGRFALDAVYCFGNCARGPTLEIDGALHSDVTLAGLDTLLPGTGQ
jgi:formate dehydrogenase subunit gamma